MINVFEVFLPQLLRYPNPSDPLNGKAATILLRDEIKYKSLVREYVLKYASVTINGSEAFLSVSSAKVPSSEEDVSMISTLFDSDVTSVGNTTLASMSSSMSQSDSVPFNTNSVNVISVGNMELSSPHQDEIDAWETFSDVSEMSDF